MLKSGEEYINEIESLPKNLQKRVLLEMKTAWINMGLLVVEDGKLQATKCEVAHWIRVEAMEVVEQIISKHRR